MSKERAITVNLGCRLNASETETMAALAESGGQAPVIVNTCAVTNEAVRQSRQAIRRAARENPGREVVVTGCAADLETEAFEAMPEVTRLIPNEQKLAPSSWSLPGDAARAPRRIDVRAPLAVQNGCDHRCTFCIIPFGRGDARSLPIEDAVLEAKALVNRGAKEVVLTGVDLTSWGPDLGEGLSLGHLVEALDAALPSDVWIRLSSIDGAEIDDRLFRLMTEVDRIAPYAHLSLQHGHDMILKRMKRRHSRADAIELCARLKEARPEMAFGADLIAGFPTETEEMFGGCLSLVEECGLSYVHVFPFSPRTGTPAAKMPQHDRALIKERAARLREVAEASLNRHLEARTNTQGTVLIEETKNGRPRGRLADFTDVHFAEGAPLKAGDRISACLLSREGRHLTAAAG
ncbi:MiaB/RimO family radical SAM methylthiotransferase [Parvularcula sp. ZS-1/3]|uniref:MiaB/RimO family radical SAM methylthiotransferase n=1 Tax=Parvularcula mediterranea TaxID=2732508 RepID=A0A7Y3W543_9PROT|nr:MiaB/RimO family radical SAM methylthiotransferase [Parvularcula mediterranea]NNU15907.1 MiaB/RimO family radical SAM methylthiotransferase [Parvularcula mediterranea]